jgi:peptide/nickel transport system substrate-binding protein
MGPIPVQGSDPATYGKHPLATGPYKVGEFAPGKPLTLVRNKEWDPATDPGRHAYPDRYKFDLAVPDDRIDAPILGRSEQAQTTISLDGVAPEDYRKAQKLGRLTVGSPPCTYFWLPDYRKITDIRVRQALGYAFPYKDQATLVRELTGETTLPGTSILPPSFPGRQDYNPLTTQPGNTDPGKARALLKEAGYAPGEFELKILYDPYLGLFSEHKAVYEKSLTAGGFKVTLQSTPTHEQYLSERDDPHAPINVRLYGWCSDWPSGGSWFPQLFQSGSVSNEAHFAEPAIDAEIGRISRLPIADQPGAWGALDKTIMTNYYPAIITGYRSATLLRGSRIANMNFDALYTTPTWKDINVLR